MSRLKIAEAASPTMAISLTFFLNAFVNFVLGLAVAAVLGPAEYGRFAVAFATGSTLATIVFDWLRLSATRFCGDGDHADAPDLRGSLDAMYMAGAIGLSLVTAAVAALGLDVGVSAALLVSIVAVGIANGHFDFWTALARARFLNGVYTKLVVVKNVLALAGMVAAGLTFQSAYAVIAANVLSVLVAYAAARPALRDGGSRFSDMRWPRLRQFATYGMPLVAAGVFYQLVVLINRWVAARALGYAAAGHLALSTDMTTRLLLAVGAGLDAYLFQIVVRADFKEGRMAAQRLVARNMLVIMAILIPLAAGYAVTMPAFTMVLVPHAYKDVFGELSLILLPGMLAFCTIQFAFAGAFTLARRTGPYVIAAAAALVCDAMLLLHMPRLTEVSIATAHSISLCVGCLVAAVLAVQTQKVWPALRDIAAVIAATGLMVAAVWPTRGIPIPWLALAMGTTIGAVVYGAAILSFDVLGCRHALVARLRRRPRVEIRAVPSSSV